MYWSRWVQVFLWPRIVYWFGCSPICCRLPWAIYLLTCIWNWLQINLAEWLLLVWVGWTCWYSSQSIPAFCHRVALFCSDPHMMQLLQNTGWPAWCSQSSQLRILRCTKGWNVRGNETRGSYCHGQDRKWNSYSRDKDWLVLTIC